MKRSNLLPGAINELIATVTDTHRLTKADCYGMMAAILDQSTSEEERGELDRLIRFLVKGRIQVTDELSTVSRLYPCFRPAGVKCRRDRLTLEML